MGGPGGGGGRGGDVGQMLDNLPALPISELKPGDAIMVSTTQGTDAGRVTAIMLLAGVEPLLTASPTATRDIMSGWNLGAAAETPGSNELDSYQPKLSNTREEAPIEEKLCPSCVALLVCCWQSL